MFKDYLVDLIKTAQLMVAYLMVENGLDGSLPEVREFEVFELFGHHRKDLATHLMIGYARETSISACGVDKSLGYTRTHAILVQGRIDEQIESLVYGIEREKQHCSSCTIMESISN